MSVPADSSRKRKAEILENKSSKTSILDGISAAARGCQSDNSAYPLPRVSNSQYDARTFSGRNVQRITPGMASNQNLQFIKSFNEGSQFGKCHFYDLNNNSLLNLQTRDGNSQRAAVENINIYGNAEFMSFIHNSSLPSPLLKSSVPEIPVPPILQHQAHDMTFQNDSNKLLSYSGAQTTSVEKAHMFFNGGIRREQRSHSLSGSSESLEVSQRSLVKQGFSHYEVDDGGTCIQDFSKFGYASELKQNGQNSDVAGPRGISNAEICSSQTSTCSVQNELHKSRQSSEGEESGRYSQNTVLGFNANGNSERKACPITGQMSFAEKSSRENICLVDREVNREGQGSTNNVINAAKVHDESSLDNVKNPSVNKILPDAADTATKNLLEHGDDPSLSPNFDVKNALNHEKVAPKIIWDGLLQLNASTTVSTLAFFKSGEKSLLVNWSKLVEVKGKVKLEAFEKYIQELPRSRTRALMVISLCWKVGSSKNGLMGMKEVAKGYSKGDKVGFAQPSPGIDLYICPNNDTIITILAKHGFFKGMAAVEGNKDSLIGCVVWRKNRSSLNPISRSSEKPKRLTPEQQFDSPSDSTVLQTEEISSPLTTAPQQEEMAQISSPLVSAMDTRSSCPVSESASTQIKVTQASNDPVKVDNFHVSNVNPELTPMVSDNSPVISTAPSAAQKNDPILHQPIKGSPKSEMPNINTAEPKKRDAGLKLLESVLTASSPILAASQQKPISNEEDDLPEFDFSTACGPFHCPEGKLQLPSWKSYFSDAQLHKQIAIEGIRNSSGPISPVPPIMRPMATISCTQRPCGTTLGGLPTDAHHGIALPRKDGESDSQAPTLAIAKEKLHILVGQTSSKPTPVKLENKGAVVQGTNSHSPHKNIWDEDDDMPEWFPPDLEHRTQTLATEATRLSNLSHVLKSASEYVPPAPLLAHQSMSVNPQFPSSVNIGLLNQHRGTTAIVPLRQERPISGFAQSSQSDSLVNPKPLRPKHPLFDINISCKPPDWRARKR